MIVRLLLGFIFLTTLTGCATFGAKSSQQEQIQTRVTELEKKVEEKDSEIVDLQYQVKDLNSKVGTKDSTDGSTDEANSADRPSKGSSVASSDETIRVNASVEDIQTALKKAGNYSGKVDGKLGMGTKQAIVEFQKEHHLTADGILGKRTWKSLKSYLKE